MIEFKKYCEIYDFIKSKENFSNDIAMILSGNINISAAMCFFSGESAIDFMIDQSDLDTLERIRMDFPEGLKQRDHIDRRIAYIKRHGYDNNISENELAPPENNNVFQYIKSWLNKKNFAKESDFYNKAGISRQLFNRIKSGDITITRDRAFHIALALGLNYEECEEFLNYLGYSFNGWDMKDEIISYILRTSKNYTLDFVDAMLVLFKQKPFRKEE